MRKVVSFLFFLLLSSSLFADNDDVQVVVTGSGANMEEATFCALRSAIEQVYGVFVSSNTLLLNDDLVRDDIASLSSGNIKSYEIIDSINIVSGSAVTVNVTVSKSSLITYTKNHGGSTDLDGQAFMMTMKKRDLDRRNEAIILKNLEDYVYSVGNCLFDYSISVSDPVLSGDSYKVHTGISAKANKNYKELMSYVYSTLKAISLSEDEAKQWRNAGLETFSHRIGGPKKEWVLRNSVSLTNILLIDFIACSAFSWRIGIQSDNIYTYSPDISHEYIGAFTRFYGKYSFYLEPHGAYLYYKVPGRAYVDYHYGLFEWDNPIVSFSVDFFFTKEEIGQLKGFDVTPDNDLFDYATNRYKDPLYRLPIALYAGLQRYGRADLVELYNSHSDECSTRMDMFEFYDCDHERWSYTLDYKNMEIREVYYSKADWPADRKILNQKKYRIVGVKEWFVDSEGYESYHIICQDENNRAFNIIINIWSGLIDRIKVTRGNGETDVMEGVPNVRFYK